MLAQRLEASQTCTLPPHVPPTSLPTTLRMGPLTLHDTIVLQISQLRHCGKTWNPTRHATIMGAHLYVKIKSHQLRPNGTPKYNSGPKPCLALVHSNHWADKTCEFPFSLPSSPSFPLTCVHGRITSPLYYYPMNMFYDLYPGLQKQAIIPWRYSRPKMPTLRYHTNVKLSRDQNSFVPHSMSLYQSNRRHYFLHCSYLIHHWWMDMHSEYIP